MSSFFSKYPLLNINSKIVTDIVTRIAIRQKYSNKLSLYYPYDMQEGDTPEIIASKYYGDPERHWIVMLANDTINPFFDYALDYPVFSKYLMDKYKNEGNSTKQWKEGNWRGEWDATEYYTIDGVLYPELPGSITYNESGTYEYIYNPNTGITSVVLEDGPNDIDIVAEYNVNDIIVTSNTAFMCANTHKPARIGTFKDALAKKYWNRIYDGAYWKGDWQNNIQYNTDDVTEYNGIIYICKQNNTSNSINGITISNADYWKTYTNGLEYALVTRNKDPFGYRATITTTDVLSGKESIETIYIDEKSYKNFYKNSLKSLDSIFNYAPSQTTQSENIEISITKDIVSVYDYELEQNENKRTINLIRKEYVSQLEQEFKILMRTYYG
jgi:hypothetical protein